MPEAQELTKSTKHPDKVRFYIESKGLTEQAARDLVARDLLLERNRKQAEELTKYSLIDSLTGLHNRRWLLGDEDKPNGSRGELHRIFEKTKRQKEALTILAIDVDKFKEINDKQGHKAGDNVLRELSNIFKNNLRVFDEIARLGGDEFLAILPETHKLSEDELKGIIDRLRRAVEKTSVTISIGVATFPNGKIIDKHEELIIFADSALYAAKQAGGNTAMRFEGISGNANPIYSSITKAE